MDLDLEQLEMKLLVDVKSDRVNQNSFHEPVNLFHYTNNLIRKRTNVWVNCASFHPIQSVLMCGFSNGKIKFVQESLLLDKKKFRLPCKHEITGLKWNVSDDNYIKINTPASRRH